MIYLSLPSGLLPHLWSDWANWKSCKVNTCFQLFGLMSRTGDFNCLPLVSSIFITFKLSSHSSEIVYNLLPMCKSVSSVQTN